MMLISLNKIHKFGIYVLFFIFITILVILVSNGRYIWYKNIHEQERTLTSSTAKPSLKIVTSNDERFTKVDNHARQNSFFSEENSSKNTKIIVITPTYRRLTRIADFTRMANTLSHIKNLYWIVIEDGISIVPAIHKILKRTGLQFTYLAHKSPPNYPNRGWFQRTMALKYLRENSKKLMNSEEEHGVVYFGDDDNSYDIRLFTDYIRNVKKIGMWGVGHVAGNLVETPRVFNKKVIGFDAQWSPNRYFAIDMAGFALGLQLILESNAQFKSSCPSGAGALESCLLEDLGLKREDIEPFGFENNENREVLVWHTKTVIPDIFDLRRSFWKSAKTPQTNGYFVEY